MARKDITFEMDASRAASMTKRANRFFARSILNPPADMNSFANSVFALAVLALAGLIRVDSIASMSTSGSSSLASTTTSSSNCTAEEKNETVSLFLNLTTIDECAGDTSISYNRIMVYPACGTACAAKVQELGDELPDCYYYVAGYDSGNMTEEVANSLAQCELWIPPPPVWVSIYADHNFSSLDGSGSDVSVDETYGSFSYDSSASDVSVAMLAKACAAMLLVIIA